MNFGDLAYISNNRIKIPDYLLKPLKIDRNSDLTIIQYSTPQEDRYQSLNIKHDFLISPTPFKIWPFQIRLKIMLNEKNGSIARMTKELKNLNINILTADCHRAGFRYLVYSIFGELHDIRTNYPQIDAAINYNHSSLSTKQVLELENKIYERCEYIKAELQKEEMKEVIFQPSERELREGMHSVEVHKSSTLPHHFWLIYNNEQPDRKDHYTKYQDGYINIPNELVEEIKRNHGLDFNDQADFPTFGFVNMDTKAPRLRVTFTPKSKIHNFRRIIFNYRRDTDAIQSSQGLINLVSTRLSESGLGIENVTNTIWKNNSLSEEGKVELITENNSSSKIDYSNLLDGIKNEVSVDSRFSRINFINKPINPFKFFVSLKFNDESRVNNFFKLLSEAGAEFGILEDDFIKTETYVTSLTKTVVENLRRCDALIQFYYNDPRKGQSADNFTWINCEAFAMGVLKKPVLKFTTVEMEDSDLPTFNRDIPVCKFDFSLEREKQLDRIRNGLDILMKKLMTSKEHLYG